jgi:hypothetical protein
MLKKIINGSIRAIKVIVVWFFVEKIIEGKDGTKLWVAGEDMACSFMRNCIEHVIAKLFCIIQR